VGLGKSIGDEIEYTDDNGGRFRVKVVGILQNAILQGGLMISEENFIKCFPSEEGYRMLLIASPEKKSTAIAQMLSERLKDFGLEIIPTEQRLAELHAVENTYLSIFASLGGLGLILGSVGLAVIVLRNVLDRSGELAMMRAIGFSRTALKQMVFYEHVLLLLAGLAIGLTRRWLRFFPRCNRRRPCRMHR